MTYKLLWMSGCPNVWCTMLGMKIKGIEYDSLRVDSEQLSLIASKFHPMDPRSKVPTLQDGTTRIYESIAILVYLEIKHPENPLFGVEPVQTALVWQRILEVINNLRDPLFVGITQPIYKSQSESIKQAAIDKMHDALFWVDQMLLDTQYLAGDFLSAADLVFMPYVQSLLRAIKSTNRDQTILEFFLSKKRI